MTPSCLKLAFLSLTALAKEHWTLSMTLFGRQTKKPTSNQELRVILLLVSGSEGCALESAGAASDYSDRSEAGGNNINTSNTDWH